MGLRNLISQEDLNKIDAWRKAYASDETISDDKWVKVFDLLEPWEEEKEAEVLGKIFKDSLILEKHIEYKADENELIYSLEKKLTNDYALYHVLEQIKLKIIKMELAPDEIKRGLGWSHSSVARALDYRALIANRIDIDEPVLLHAPEGHKDIIVTPGMKAMKLCQKIAAMYDDITGFEELRLAQSMISNTATFKGTLCLSIHPLDYMTMSDNASGWDSCMNWKYAGSYRLGTVEMMNSPSVIVAYLKSDKEDFHDVIDWNNKKWRSLFIINSAFITNVKGYPYQSDVLNNMCFNWLRELGEKKGYHWTMPYYSLRDGHIEYINNIILPITDFMYNDYTTMQHKLFIDTGAFITSKKDRAFKISTNRYDKPNHIFYNYSGPAQCMCCGTTDHDTLEDNNSQEASRLCCADCEGILERCEHCGTIIHNDWERYGIDGEILCEDCFSTLTCIESRHQDTVFLDDVITFTVVSNGAELGDLYILLSDVETFCDDLGIDESDSTSIEIKNIPEEAWDKWNMIYSVNYGCLNDQERPRYLRRFCN